MNINHIAIWCIDLERMKVFYTTHFACKAGKIYKNSARQFSSYFLDFNSGCRIELMHQPDIHPKAADQKAGYAHIAIEVGNDTDVDMLTLQMEQKGIKIIGRPRKTGDGYYESTIADPEGNLVELVAIQ